MKIAFYAPIKPPDHPIVSGDREIARLLIRALDKAGFETVITSRYISYQKRPSAELFEARRAGARDEISRLKAEWSILPARERPAAWLTYHPYCKAPDWIGPAIAAAFNVPYLTVEACRTRQDSDEDWQSGREQVQRAVLSASLNFCLKPSDYAYLTGFLSDVRKIFRIAPFAEIEQLDEMEQKPDLPQFSDDAPVLIAVGMMRPGAKLHSYDFLAKSLIKIKNLHWNIIIVGDGPERLRIESAFSPLGTKRVMFTGKLDRSEVISHFRNADIFTWPGYREAIGMVFIEAQSQRLPVVAMNSLGVPIVVRDGRTGILVPENDITAYSAALAALITDPHKRISMGRAARRNVKENHDIEAAAASLASGIGSVVAVQL